MTVKCEMGDYALVVHGRVSHGAEVDRRPGEGLSEAQLMSSRSHLDAAMQLKSEQCTGKSRVISVKSSFLVRVPDAEHST